MAICKVCNKVMKRVTNTHISMHDMSRFQYDRLKEDRTKTIVVEMSNKGYKYCRVCGKSMQRLTDIHLKSHGMTRKQYYELPVWGVESKVETVDSKGNVLKIDDCNIDSMLPEIIKRIVDNGNSEEVLNCVKNIIHKRNEDYNIVAEAIVLKKMKDLSVLLSEIDSMKTTLFSKAKSGNVYQLIQTIRLASEEVDNTLARIERLAGVAGEIPSKGGDTFNTLIYSDRVPEDKEKRETVLNKFRILRSLINETNK